MIGCFGSTVDRMLCHAISVYNRFDFTRGIQVRSLFRLVSLHCNDTEERSVLLDQESIFGFLVQDVPEFPISVSL